MTLPDVNVLIYAFRRESPHHGLCRGWLERTVAADAAFGVSPLALSALVRITTNRRIMSTPSTPEEAFAFCEALTGAPNCHVVEPGERHWSIFRRLCLETGVTGADVSDVWYAALAIEHGCEWITLDAGFSRFPALDWSRPDP